MANQSTAEDKVIDRRTVLEAGAALAPGRAGAAAQSACQSAAAIERRFYAGARVQETRDPCGSSITKIWPTSGPFACALEGLGRLRAP
jgi:hypothetical protein